jgi:Holliday junction resolvase RusA-like endonuclease
MGVMRVDFFAPGLPGTKGSARAYVRGGRAVIVNDASAKAKPWAATVALAAREAMDGVAPFTGSVRVTVMFYLPRPRAHFRANGVDLKATAPHYVPKRPDGDKLERCAWDALTGVVFGDDAQIVEWSGRKEYSTSPGARFVVETVGGAMRAIGAGK